MELSQAMDPKFSSHLLVLFFMGKQWFEPILSRLFTKFKLVIHQITILLTHFSWGEQPIPNFLCPKVGYIHPIPLVNMVNHQGKPMIFLPCWGHFQTLRNMLREKNMIIFPQKCQYVEYSPVNHGCFMVNHNFPY